MATREPLRRARGAGRRRSTGRRSSSPTCSRSSAPASRRRDGRPARPRPRDRGAASWSPCSARRAAARARSSTSPPGSTSPRPATCAPSARSLGRLDERELAAYRARQIAVIFQSDNLWPALTAQENVATMLRLAGVHDAADGAPTRRWPRSASAERRQSPRRRRCPAASSSASPSPAPPLATPTLVLADEPTGELDAANETIVLDALRELREHYGATVVVVTHSPRGRRRRRPRHRAARREGGLMMSPVCKRHRTTPAGAGSGRRPLVARCRAVSVVARPRRDRASPRCRHRPRP